MMRNGSCGVDCTRSGTSTSGAVRVRPPKPTSARQICPSSSTRSSICPRAVTTSSRHIPAHPRRQTRHLKAQGTQDGVQEQILLEALARKDGSVVWQWQAPGGTNAWPAVVGDTIIWPIGLGDSPQVVALRLNANQPTATPEQQRTPVLTPQGN